MQPKFMLLIGVLVLLLGAGVYVFTSTGEDLPPPPAMSIIEAGQLGNFQQVRANLAAGANADTKDANNRTPLHWAVFHNDNDMVKLLIAHGADVNALNIEGDTPLQWAAQKGLRQIVKTLIEHGAWVENTNHAGNTPLLDACRAGNSGTAIVEMLLAHGANVNACDADGNSPLDLALENSDQSLAEFLAKHGGKNGE